MQQWIIVTILPDKALAPQVCKENTALTEIETRINVTKPSLYVQVNSNEVHLTVVCVCVHPRGY